MDGEKAAFAPAVSLFGDADADDADDVSPGKKAKGTMSGLLDDDDDDGAFLTATKNKGDIFGGASIGGKTYDADDPLSSLLQ